MTTPTEDDGFITIHHSPYIATQCMRSELVQAPPSAPAEDAGWRWYSGKDGEHYSGTHDTREEAIAELDGYGGYIVEARQDPVQLSSYIDADDILGAAEESVYDLANEDGDPIFDATKDQRADLNARLKAACDAWQTAHGLVFAPYRFTASRNEERIEETPRVLREFVTDEVTA